MRAKGEECSKLTAERDLLAAQLAEQKELLKKTQKEAEEEEAALLAEFASERSSWTDKEAMLVSGFHDIEDLVDGELLCFPSSSRQLYVEPTRCFFDLFFIFSVLADFFPATCRPPFKLSRPTSRSGRRVARRSRLMPLGLLTSIF